MRTACRNEICGVGLALLFTTIANAADSPENSRPVPDLGAALRTTLEQKVLFDQPGDGAIWARGLTYKARFASDGFTYIPFLGSGAPRNEPLRFAIKEVSVGGRTIEFNAAIAPVMEANRVRFDRGAVREIYELRPREVEQEFEIDPGVLRSGAEVRVRLQALGDLPLRESSGGLVFHHERGDVQFGQAAAVDHSGRKVTLTTKLNAAGEIEISVPASFKSVANSPLVIDPVITTVGVENTVAGTRSPDVALDVVSDHYGVVYEQIFSASDVDAYCVMVSHSNGTVVAGSLSTVDFTADVWRNPRISAVRQGDQFLIAAEVGLTPNRIIRGRTRLGADLTMSLQFDISDSSQSGDKHNPDIGGEPFVGPETNWLVVWERDFSASDHDVHGKLVSNTGAPTGSTILIDNSTALDTNPQISNSDDGFVFLVVWQRTVGASHDIYAATMNDIGTIEQEPILVDTSSDDDTLPAVSARTNPGVAFLVVYQENGGDLFARLMQNSTLVAQGNLTALSGAPAGSKQFMPSVDTDGTKFIVTYAERRGADESNYDIYSQTFCQVGFSLKASEGRKCIGHLDTDERFPRVCCYFNSHNVSHDGMIVWHDGGPTGYGDIFGALYQTPFACCPADIAPLGGDGVINVSDLLAVINQWSGSCFACNGDVNGDQAVNVADLLAVINGWGVCP